MRWRERDGFPAEDGSGESAGLPRRALLRGLTAGGGAVAAVAASTRVGAEQDQSEPASDDPTKLDYSETEHVRWYYRRARM